MNMPIWKLQSVLRGNIGREPYCLRWSRYIILSQVSGSPSLIAGFSAARAIR